IQGAAADLLLADEQFVARWLRLWQECPWSTSYQSPTFVGKWYQTYHQQFSPLLLTLGKVDQDLEGILPLAIDGRTEHIVVAGAHQAEYQAWICDPKLANTFPTQAMAELFRAIPATRLSFRYLPPGTPLNWLAGATCEDLFLLKPWRRPVLRL